MTSLITAFEHLPRFRAIGGDQFVAGCPAHDDHSPSLCGRVRDHKLLLKCQAGCATEDVLSTMGLTWQSLFEGGSRRNPVIKRQSRAIAGFRRWREKELYRTAAELRRCDRNARLIDTAVVDGMLTEDDAWSHLDFYRSYSELEDRFDILRTGTDREALEVYRRG